MLTRRRQALLSSLMRLVKSSGPTVALNLWLLQRVRQPRAWRSESGFTQARSGNACNGRFRRRAFGHHRRSFGTAGGTSDDLPVFCALRAKFMPMRDSLRPKFGTRGVLASDISDAIDLPLIRLRNKLRFGGYDGRVAYGGLPNNRWAWAKLTLKRSDAMQRRLRHSWRAA